MSIERRIEELEKKYGKEEGCIVVLVTYYGLPKPPEGAADRYIEGNKQLCDKCTQNGLCVLYWNGETFSHRKPQGKRERNAFLTPTQL